MKSVIVLDSTPLGLLLQRKGHPDARQCRRWIDEHAAAGGTVAIPDIVDYEVRRELLRLQLSHAIQRLDNLYAEPYVRRLSLDTATLQLAARLWAQARQEGMPTADRFALDIDVILAAQVLTSGIPAADLCVATANVRHLAPFVAAQEWTALAASTS
jgi:predicted nucleic acid-binding protein